MRTAPCEAPGLEHQLQAELEDAGIVGGLWLQEAVPCAGAEARWIGGIIVCTAKAGQRIVGDAAAACGAGGGIAAGPLGVIEDVEALGAELQGNGFMDGDIFVESHVEIEAAGIVQEVSAGVAEGEARGRGKGGGIVEQRSGAGSQ